MRRLSPKITKEQLPKSCFSPLVGMVLFSLSPIAYSYDLITREKTNKGKYLRKLSSGLIIRSLGVLSNQDNLYSEGERMYGRAEAYRITKKEEYLD